jgi:heterodisulfide reductase subunit A-like polyferredoxin
MLISTPRYLASFHPKQVPHFFTDILVIGSGLAGLRAALGVGATGSQNMGGCVMKLMVLGCVRGY